jgi:hypothetical protein
MHSILLFRPDDRPFDIPAVQRVFQSEPDFHNVRFDTPGGTAVEADYIQHAFRTIVGLSGDHGTISLRGVSDASLRAALILQRHLDTPLRMVDTDYSFDLILEGVSTVEELRDAIERARTS